MKKKPEGWKSSQTIPINKKPKPAEKDIKEENLKEKQLIKESNEADEKIQIKEAPIDASLIDIKVIKETNDESNKDSPESDAQNSEELELALKEMPGISSSVSKEILAKAAAMPEVGFVLLSW